MLWWQYYCVLLLIVPLMMVRVCDIVSGLDLGGLEGMLSGGANKCKFECEKAGTVAVQKK